MSARAILLADLAELRRYLAAIPGPPSTMGPALEAARTGVLGDGCSVRYPTVGRELRRAPERPLSYARMWGALASLPGHSVRVWLLSPCVLDLDKQIPAPLVLPGPGKRTHALELTERLGWDYGSAAQQARWGAALRSGDSRPARTAMGEIGGAALDRAAVEWVAS